jgi:2-phospho-L-lactate guanylyltransferase
VLPLKALDRAKGRLSGDLDPAMRRALTAWMFGRVLTACHQASQVGGVLVVAGDAAAAALARAHGVPALVEPRPGLAAAMAAADRACASDAATLVVAADLPLVRPEELDQVCAAGADPGVVVAPTRDGGTGALLRRPPLAIPTRYGPGSAAAHLALAAAAGVPAVRLELPGLALDIDTAGQLQEAATLDEGLRRWTAGVGRDRAVCGDG